MLDYCFRRSRQAPEGKGTAEIRADINPEYAEITLIDSGTPYDPLAKPDSDVKLSAE
ncbi:MAG: ATP-binding protein [Ruminococcus sp.]|nr:ATP-binding protein [Ruminococcus sp.]